MSKHFWLRSFALTIVRDPLRIVGQMSTEESKQKFLLECVESEQQKESDRLISGPRNTSFQRVQVFRSKLVAICCEWFDVGAWPTTFALRSSAVVKVIGANLFFGVLWGTWLSPPKRFLISSPFCSQSPAVFWGGLLLYKRFLGGFPDSSLHLSPSLIDSVFCESCSRCWGILFGYFSCLSWPPGQTFQLRALTSGHLVGLVQTEPDTYELQAKSLG